MQKTKLISKDFIRDCRVGRQRRENTIYTLPISEEEPQLPLPHSHSLFLQEDSYSIDDFILNLQADHFLHYNDYREEAQEARLLPQSPSIEQINHQYFQRIAQQPPFQRIAQQPPIQAVPQQPPKEAVPQAERKRVSFGSELSVKYFRDDNAPSAIGDSEEHGYLMEEQERNGCLIQEGF